MSQPDHPLDRHLFYGQESLFPADTLRLRLDLGHRLDSGGLLIVREVHDMPSRRQVSLDMRGGIATDGGFQLAAELFAEALTDFATERIVLQRDRSPF